MTYLLTPWVRALAVRYGVVDRPNARRPHKHPTARGGAGHQCTDQARPRGIGHAAKLLQTDSGPLDDRLGQGQQITNVVARSQFRHHAAIFRMEFNLAVQYVGEQTALAVIDREAGFIAGAFDSQDYHRSLCCRAVSVISRQVDI